MLTEALDDSPDPEPHLAIRPAQRMPRESQIRLRRLLLWRDEEARIADKPRRWILDNDTAIRLADRPPESYAVFERFLDAQPKAPRRKREQLWDLLQAAPSAEEQDIPLAESTEDVDKNALRALQAEVAAVATELDLPEGLLCARRHIESLLRNHRWPRALDGWRAELLRDRLLAKVG